MISIEVNKAVVEKHAWLLKKNSLCSPIPLLDLLAAYPISGISGSATENTLFECFVQNVFYDCHFMLIIFNRTTKPIVTRSPYSRMDNLYFQLPHYDIGGIELV